MSDQIHENAAAAWKASKAARDAFDEGKRVRRVLKQKSCGVWQSHGPWQSLSEGGTPNWYSTILTWEIEPDPPKPRPYTPEEAIHLRYKIVKDRDGNLFSVVSTEVSSVTLCGVNGRVRNWSYREFADDFTHMDGRPCGIVESEATT